jgi:hypothetical protein
MAIRGGGVTTAEQRAADMAANSLAWLLTEGHLAHPGLRGHLIAARVQLDAAQVLLAIPSVKEEP